MIKCILEFNHNIYIKNIPNNKYTIKDLFITTIDKKYINEFTINLYNNNYYFIEDNKIIHPDTNIVNTNSSYIYIKCYRKQNGGLDIPGGGGYVDMVKDALNSILNPIVAPIKAIAIFFNAIYKFLRWCGLFMYWCWFFAVWLFTDLLNPAHFIEDFFNTTQILIMTIFSSVFNILMICMRFSINIVGGWTQGFWGWDQSSLTQEDRDSNYFKKLNKTNNKKCYLTNTNTIPFSIILGTILCPPIGVFMDMGLTGWFNILICVLLTLFFYIPGLLYALLIIYS